MKQKEIVKWGYAFNKIYEHLLVKGFKPERSYCFRFREAYNVIKRMTEPCLKHYGCCTNQDSWLEYGLILNEANSFIEWRNTNKDYKIKVYSDYIPYCSEGAMVRNIIFCPKEVGFSEEGDVSFRLIMPLWEDMEKRKDYSTYEAFKWVRFLWLVQHCDSWILEKESDD